MCCAVVNGVLAHRKSASGRDWARRGTNGTGRGKEGLCSWTVVQWHQQEAFTESAEVFSPVCRYAERRHKVTRSCVDWLQHTG